MPGSTDTSSSLAIQVAKDRLQAWLVLKAHVSTGFVPPTLADILVALDHAQVLLNDDVRRRAADAVTTIAGAARGPAGAAAAGLPERFLIAEGHAPVEGEDGRVEWAPGLTASLDKPDEDDAIDYFARCTFVTVPAGAPIGRLVPPREGGPGVDVYGQAQAPRKPRGEPLRLGPNVRLAAPESDQVVAEVAGRVVIEGGRIRICEMLELLGDVDFASGSIDACVDVYVRGTVRAKFKVHTSASLHVNRVIEAADIDVGRDLTVRGGIFGHECSGHVHVGGNVTVKLLNEVTLEAGGDIHFTKEILNSHVRARGHVVGERGTIIGGETYAREGITVRVLGSEACITTVAAVGTHVDALRRVRQSERQVRELEKSRDPVRQALRPLAADRRRLSPAQRAQAGDLLLKMNAIELQMSGLQQQIDRLLREGAPLGTPGVLVSETAYPGTRIRIQAREARLRSALHGPVRVELRKVKDVTELVAVSQRTGSVTVLPSVEVDLDAPPADKPAKMGTSHERNETTPGGGCA